MKIQIIVGSTRPERVSDRVAKWVANALKAMPDVEPEIVDLAEYELPFIDEPISPQYNPNRKPSPVGQKLLDTFAQAEAFVLVTPEYNRSYSAVLKNALDYVDFQFKQKPVMLVAHGSTGGAQAIGHLRGVVPGLQAISIPQAVYVVGGASAIIDEQGNLSEEVKTNPYGPHTALEAATNDLVWYTKALSAARG